MEYNFTEIEKKWQLFWQKQQTYRVAIDASRPKFYVLDMFPYPSGAGLHVGHPLGYIASDIYSRFKKLKGFNVLHPMGYDAFGLPAEQYAIQTGQHPAVTTSNNIKRYREQLDRLGLSYDWNREVQTCDPSYYKWTQWIFLQLFDSWFNNTSGKAERIETLIKEFRKDGNSSVNAACSETAFFTSAQWNAFSEKEQQQLLLNYRLAFLSNTMVNWCPALGTVLANEEVKDGVSERGGYPVERKLMNQWSLRISAYADRLLSGLDGIDWSESLKESQRNWIGKSEGALINFQVASPRPSPKEREDNFDDSPLTIRVFTTRPDTIFGVTFITLAPEHELVSLITTREYTKNVEEYIAYAKNRSERERMADVKKITGQFTGAYAMHPFTGEEIPVWIGDYVLAGYGTGAVMAVPGHDARDYAFAKYFDLEIKEVVAGGDLSKESYDAKEGLIVNSDFLNGLNVKEAIKKSIDVISYDGHGEKRVNYRLRDAVFGRQRYWGEPIPIYYKNGIPYPLPESELPLVLPEVDKFLPTETGEPPLGRARNWKFKGEYDYELTTMPGWAGSSWYFLRYMDAKNELEFASAEALNYWKEVDLYLGGSEHATGHLLYVRFWTKFLFDLGYIPVDEPAKKLINQGMIQGVSKKAFKFTNKSNYIIPLSGMFSKLNLEFKTISNELLEHYISFDLLKIYLGSDLSNKDTTEYVIEKTNERLSSYSYRIHAENIPIEFSENGYLNINQFVQWASNTNKVFYTQSGYWYQNKFNIYKDLDGNEINIINDPNHFELISEVEKMSKSKWNVVSPDAIIEQYGADCLRLYEMFLGPIEQSKPWNTNGITGVSGFLKKLWRLFFNDSGFAVSDASASPQELKVLHKTIKKVTGDMERFSFNTSVSTFMICVNELTDLKCNKREILEPLTILIAPFAPHLSEELWSRMGHKNSIVNATYPECNEKYLIENEFEYPVSINGKTRFQITLALNLTKEEVEKEVLNSENMIKYLNENTVKKVIVVPGRIVNVVI